VNERNASQSLKEDHPEDQWPRAGKPAGQRSWPKLTHSM